MTTRDPRYRDRAFPDQGGGIDPTQSLSIDGEDVDRDSHPSLALGTHEAAEAAAREERTRIESPGARVKTPPPPSAKRPPPVPKGDGEPERVGQTLGSYKILELLGKGGMGYVFRAEHVKLGREVALKLLRSDYAKRRDAVARFFQEARTVNRVRHRNIVDVTDFVELDDGTTFIIMELLRGQSLGRWARTGIDMPRALAVLVQICDGLAAAHSVGVVHRDLKPDNVIVVPTSDGAELVKLLDFGVAKLLNRDDEDVGFQTQAGSVIGTPAYMSPEQAGGMAIDHRSDIYSLGAIMYELFCGTPMFRGRSFGEYVRKHLTEMPVPPSQTDAGKLIDPRLEQIILCCLQKDPNQRFPTIPILRDALLGILGAIETHPPSFATSSHHSGQHSGQHVEHSGMIPRQLAPGVAAVMPTMLPPNPQQQMLATILPSSPVPLPGLLPSAPYHAPASYTQHPSTYIPPQGTPWWVWAVGGAIAVGLGISAAVWYAGRDDASTRALAAAAPVAPVRPSVEAIVTEIDVHFDATPRAQVFAEGNPTPLCQTPCPVHIDLNDGGGKTQRTFVLRAPGFQDESLIVDLAPSAPRAFRVPLDPAPTPAPTITAQPKPPEELVVRTELEPEEPAPKRGTKRPTRSSKASMKPGKPVATPDEPPPRETTPTPTPVEPKPKPKKPDPAKIDQAQTLDPFRKTR